MTSKSPSASCRLHGDHGLRYCHQQEKHQPSAPQSTNENNVNASQVQVYHRCLKLGPLYGWIASYAHADSTSRFRVGFSNGFTIVISRGLRDSARTTVATTHCFLGDLVSVEFLIMAPPAAICHHPSSSSGCSSDQARVFRPATPSSDPEDTSREIQSYFVGLKNPRPNRKFY